MTRAASVQFMTCDCGRVICVAPADAKAVEKGVVHGVATYTECGTRYRLSLKLVPPAAKGGAA